MSKNLEKKSSRKFQAANDYLTIEPDKVDDKKGGVYVANATKRRAASGTVISVGEGRLLPNGEWSKPPAKAGDVVLFNPNLLQEVEHDGVKVYIISANAIYGRYE